MSEYQNDPVKGYLALEMVDKLAAEIGTNSNRFRKKKLKN